MKILTQGGNVMKKLSKRYSFIIGRVEEDAIDKIRNYDINVSKYLRASLRNLYRYLQENENKAEYCILKVRENDDIEKFAFLLED